MKILLSAYSCLPNEGSESGIGWNWAKHLAAAGNEVVVLTRGTNKPRIEQECATCAIENPRFLFHELPEPLPRLYRLPFGNYLFYVLWQYSAAKVALRAHITEKFDCVQHVTWACFRLPSFMGRLNIPFIFGPVGGGEDTPKAFRKGLGWRGRLWDALRRSANWLSTLNPLLRYTFSSATTIVATTPATLSVVPRSHRHKGVVHSSVAVDGQQQLSQGPREISTIPDSRPRSRLELLFVGRLLPWKGLHLGLKALARAIEGNASVHLTIVGSGSDEARLKGLVKSLSLTDAVTWIPWVKQSELASMYGVFDALLFPSLHDSGGLAVLEAMTFGLPVLCLDLGGPGRSVNDSCGKVFATSGLDENALVITFAAFLRQAMEDPALLAALAAGAKVRSSRLTWTACVSQLYRTAFTLHEGRPKVEFAP
jgi:glycosyltransferase involved in cell wall biosynthesis